MSKPNLSKDRISELLSAHFTAELGYQVTLRYEESRFGWENPQNPAFTIFESSALELIEKAGYTPVPVEFLKLGETYYMQDSGDSVCRAVLTKIVRTETVKGVEITPFARIKNRCAGTPDIVLACDQLFATPAAAFYVPPKVEEPVAEERVVISVPSSVEYVAIRPASEIPTGPSSWGPVSKPAGVEDDPF